MKNSNIKIGTNKSFEIVFFLFFLIVAIFPLFNDGNIRIWSLIMAIFFLILGLLNSKSLTPMNKIWFKVRIILSSFISSIFLGIVFLLIVTPTSLIMKVLGKNLLNLRRGNNETYWVEKSKLKSKMKNQL